MQAIRVLSRAELEALAREAYQARYREAPKPETRNADALVQLGEPRRLIWRGRRLYVPPLPYRLGARLLTVRMAIDAGESGPRTLALAARLARQAVRPATLRVRLALWARGNPFRPLTRIDALQLLDTLLHVPDAAPPPPPTTRVVLDCVDSLMEFVLAFPALCHRGEPISWAHYVYGLRHLARSRAREDLRGALAGRIAQTPDKEAWSRWTAEQASAAGWG